MPIASPNILYLHGLNSSPASHKASQLQRAMAHMGLTDNLSVPALHHHPRVAIAHIEGLIETLGRPVLVGSSLGGYYATHLAERHGLKALLINPAVQPHLRFDGYLGPQTNFYSDETWELTADHVSALAELDGPAPTATARYQVWLQTADETLDYRHAGVFYRQCALRIQAGGDHGFQGFVERLPMLFAFAGIAPQYWRDIDFTALDTQPVRA